MRHLESVEVTKTNVTDSSLQNSVTLEERQALVDSTRKVEKSGNEHLPEIELVDSTASTQGDHSGEDASSTASKALDKHKSQEEAAEKTSKKPEESTGEKHRDSKEKPEAPAEKRQEKQQERHEQSETETGKKENPTTKEKIDELDKKVKDSEEEHGNDSSPVDGRDVADVSVDILDKATEVLRKSGVDDTDAKQFIKWMKKHLSSEQFVKQMENLAKGGGIAMHALDAFEVYQRFKRDGFGGGMKEIGGLILDGSGASVGQRIGGMVGGIPGAVTFGFIGGKITDIGDWVKEQGVCPVS